MDTRSGQIYDSREAAVAAGVPDQHLVTGDRAALEPLSRLITREAVRRARQAKKRSASAKAAKRAMQAKSRKRNRR